jgi:hypothetical protein
MNNEQNASTGAFAPEVQRRAERMVGGINREKKRIYKTSGGRKSPFRTGVVTTTERREFATPVFLFEYIG